MQPQAQPQYAGFWTRGLAFFIDLIILYILEALIGFVFGLVYGIVLRTSEGARGIGLILGVVISWLYHASLESSTQQATLGKQALGIIVTDIDGKQISFARATGRHFAKFLPFSLIVAAFTEKKQGLHDLIAGTLVMKK